MICGSHGVSISNNIITSDEGEWEIKNGYFIIRGVHRQTVLYYYTVGEDEDMEIVAPLKKKSKEKKSKTR